jgi:hypothetical protein
MREHRYFASCAIAAVVLLAGCADAPAGSSLRRSRGLSNVEDESPSDGPGAGSTTTKKKDGGVSSTGTSADTNGNSKDAGTRAPPDNENPPMGSSGGGQLPIRDAGMPQPEPVGDGGFNLGPNASVNAAPGATLFTFDSTTGAAAGMRMSMNLVASPGQAGGKGTITASNISIEAPTASGIRFLRPTLRVESSSGTVLGVASFVDVDMQFPAGRKGPFAKLAIQVEGYEPNTRLRLIFGAVVPSSTREIVGLPATIYAECKAPQLFAPAVSQHWNQTQPPCKNCHGGLFAFEYFGKDDATACGLNKVLLRAGGPNLARPTAGGHSGGLMPNAGAYTQALSAWRAAEQ